MFDNKNAVKPGVGKQVRIRMPEDKLVVLDQTSPEERGDAIFMHEDLIQLLDDCVKMLKTAELHMLAGAVETSLDNILNK